MATCRICGVTLGSRDELVLHLISAHLEDDEQRHDRR
jgi:hypothetical protein